MLKFHPDTPPGSEDPLIVGKTQWLMRQTQAAKFAYVCLQNWDNFHDEIEEGGPLRALVDDPETDLSTIARLYWGADPNFTLNNPEHDFGFFQKINGNLENGFYPKALLSWERAYFHPWVKKYLERARRRKTACLEDTPCVVWAVS